MATDSILGLFTSPEQYQLAQNQQLLDQSMKLAQLGPFEGARASTMYGAGLIGRAMGSEDPMLKLQSLRQSLAQGKDFTSSEGWGNYAKELQAQGDLQGAATAAQRAVEIQRQIDEKQAQRASMEAIAAGRNETNMQIANLRAQMSQATNALQAQLIQAKIDALQAKQEKAPVADDKAATRIGQNTVFDTLIGEGDTLTKTIDANKDSFSLGGRAATAIKSVMNPSAPSVQAVSDVDSYLKKARNAYLLAAKGTQTEGDAQRAWEEFAGRLDFSSAEGAKRSVERIQKELSTQKQSNEAYLKSRGIQSGPALGTKENPIKLK
jgi:tetratricopeptide (TPR) repeat protein